DPLAGRRNNRQGVVETGAHREKARGGSAHALGSRRSRTLNKTRGPAPRDSRARGSSLATPMGYFFASFSSSLPSLLAFLFALSQCFFPWDFIAAIFSLYVFIWSGVSSLESDSSRSAMICCADVFILVLSPAAAFFASAIF